MMKSMLIALALILQGMAMVKSYQRSASSSVLSRRQQQHGIHSIKSEFMTRRRSSSCWMKSSDDPSSSASSISAESQFDADEILLQASKYSSWTSQSFLQAVSIVSRWWIIPADATNLVKICDEIDTLKGRTWSESLQQGQLFSLPLLKLRRYQLLVDILTQNQTQYIQIASFLSSRIARNELPNLQNIPYTPLAGQAVTIEQLEGMGWDHSYRIADDGYIADCKLEKIQYEESVLDKLLLNIFRKLVQKEINFKSETTGIRGLLEEGRHFKLSPLGEVDNSQNQHRFVKNVLGGLLTPVLPPFYRIFMSGIIPSKENKDPELLIDIAQRLIDLIPDSLAFKKDLVPGKQIGPWFYAPFLTSVVTPPFLAFLLGPCHVNRRKDGQLGGMVVEKCKFLQESNCKGLCLHQCKIPAQEFFKDNLGMDLSVSPNFITQECQWSWGEVAIPHGEDPSFPKGCLQGCDTKTVLK